MNKKCVQQKRETFELGAEAAEQVSSMPGSKLFQFKIT